MINNKNIIALSGTHCVGKSFMREELKLRLKHRYNVIDVVSSSTDLKTLKDITQDHIQTLVAGRETQLLLDLLTDTSILKRADLILKDRCIVDTVVYSQYFYECNKISKQTLTLVEQIAASLYKHYKHIFILTAVDSIPYVLRDKYTMDEESRLVINDLFVAFYEKHKASVPLTLVTGETYTSRINSVYTDISSM